MGKFSKRYNQDQKQIKCLSQTYHTYWEAYNEILNQVQFGQFDTALVNIFSLSDDVKKYQRIFFQKNNRVKKLFLQKWVKKYGKYTEDPFQLLLDDLNDFVQSISIRKEFMKKYQPST